MTGNPFHPKASGYTPAIDPVTRLTEMFGRLGSTVENLFHGFTRLADGVKAMDRQVGRLGFIAALFAGGPGSRIPYDLRDALGLHGGTGRGVGGLTGLTGFGGVGAASAEDPVAAAARKAAAATTLRRSAGADLRDAQTDSLLARLRAARKKGEREEIFTQLEELRGKSPEQVADETAAKYRPPGGPTEADPFMASHGVRARRGERVQSLEGSLGAAQTAGDRLLARLGLDRKLHWTAPGWGDPHKPLAVGQEFGRYAGGTATLFGGQTRSQADNTGAHEAFHFFKDTRYGGVLGSLRFEELVNGPLEGALRRYRMAETVTGLFSRSGRAALSAPGFDDPEETLSRMFAADASGHGNWLTRLAYRAGEVRPETFARLHNESAADFVGPPSPNFRSRTLSGQFFKEFYDAGKKGLGRFAAALAAGGRGGWNFIRPGGGLATFWDADPDKSQAIGKGIGQFGRHALLGGTIVAGGMLKAASPVAFDTLYKSFELALTKFGAGTVGPSIGLSRRLQNASRWADRNPDLADLVGKGAVFTIALGAGVVAVNALAAAATRAAAVLTFMGRWGGAMRAAPWATPAVTAGGSAVGSATTGAVGGAAAGGAGWMSRGRGAVAAGRAAGRLAGWAWPLGAAVEAHSNMGRAQNDLEGAAGHAAGQITPPGLLWSSTYGPLDLVKDSSNWLLRNFGGVSREELDQFDAYKAAALHHINPFKAGGSIEKQLGFSPNPFAWIGLAKTAKDVEDPHMLVAPASRVQPQFVQLEEIYKQAAMAAAVDPFEQELNQARNKNDVEALKQAFDQSETGKVLRSLPPALPAR